MPLQSIQFYMGMILIRFQFLINVNSISIISWVLLSISITISITKTGPYQYQYIINFSKFSLSISMPISILHFPLINISLSMHCATLLSTFEVFRNVVRNRFAKVGICRVGLRQLKSFWKIIKSNFRSAYTIVT